MVIGTLPRHPLSSTVRPDWKAEHFIHVAGPMREVNAVSLALKLLEKFIECIVTPAGLKFHSFTLPLDSPDSVVIVDFFRGWREFFPAEADDD